MSGGTGVIDLDALKRLLSVIGGDRDGLADLIVDFSEGAPELALQIRDAAEALDAARLRMAAHSLKSNARDFGAAELAVVCAALESKAREGNLGDASRAAAEVHGLVARAVEDLSRIAVADV